MEGIRFRDGVSPDQVRSMLETLFELEVQLPAKDTRWSKLRMMRRVLGDLLTELDEPVKGAA